MRLRARVLARGMARWRPGWALALVLAFADAPAGATTVVPLSEANLVADAVAIVIGEVTRLARMLM